MAAGRLDVAASRIEWAWKKAPADVDLLNNAGAVLTKAGRLGPALRAYQQCLARAPELVRALSGMANLLCMMGRPKDAVEPARKAFRLQPDNVVAALNLGRALFETGDALGAEVAFRQVLAAEPDHAVALSNLGVLVSRGSDDEAIALCRKAAALAPQDASMWINLALVLRRGNRMSEATQAADRALAIAPKLWKAWDCKAATLAWLGFLPEARQHFEKARGLGAPPESETVRLFSELLDDTTSPLALAREHRRWAARVFPKTPHRPAAAPLGGRPLRVGLVSADFRTHSCAWFVQPLLRALDRQRCHVTCYSNVEKGDGVTAAIQALADRWRDCFSVDADTVAGWVAEDGIDVLIDLGGLTSGNRLDIFARRPAPLQATWLGYANTTGLGAMDLRIVDHVTDPAGSEAAATEKLLRLPGCFLCYQPHGQAGDVVEPPVLKAGHITFGSFNNLTKIGPTTFAAWGRVLAQCAGSRLLLKAHPDDGMRGRILAGLTAQGVAAERIRFLDYCAAPKDHFAAYGQVDIALDTFPYNGTTTTCEALWMGVPVLSMDGDRHVSRVGASLLRHAGFGEWVADDAPDLAKRAAALASDPGRLGHLRRSMRQALLGSPLLDADSYAARFLQALVEEFSALAAG